MDAKMETNKWLWQPHKGGPIHLRLSYRDIADKLKTFTRSLNTNHYPTARKIRDTEFMPIILDMDRAKTQMDLIKTLYPDLEKQMQKGVHGGFAKDSSLPVVTVDSLATEWGKALSVSGGNFSVATSTARRYKPISRRFSQFIGKDHPISDISSLNLCEYRDERLIDYGKTKKTVELELTALRAMFQFAIERRYLSENPAEGVTIKMTSAEKARTKQKRPNPPPTHEQAERICTDFPVRGKSYTTDDFQDYAMVARYTGMRQGEIAHIRVQDLQLYPSDLSVEQILTTPKNYEKPFKGKFPAKHVLCIYIRDSDAHGTKTGHERIVPVADKLLPTLRKLMKQVNQGPLFPFAAKDSGGSFGKKWLRCVKHIDSSLTMHGFRHYATSEMENNGINTSISRMVVGHAQDTSVHGTYVHRNIGSLKAAVDKIY